MSFSVVLLFATSITMASMGVFAWLLRRQSGALALMAYYMVTAGWCFSLGKSILSVDYQETRSYFLWAMLGMFVLPILFFIFTTYFIGNPSWVTPVKLGLLFVIPLLSLLIAKSYFLSNLLIYGETFLSQAGYSEVRNYKVGIWYYIQALYSLAFLLYGLGLTAWQLFNPSGNFRSQSRDLLFSLTPAIGILILNSFRPNKSLGVDTLLPFGAVLAGLGITWTYIRHQVLDLIPIARWTQIEIMADGMLALDKNKHVTDLNQSMQAISGLPAKSSIGLNALSLLPSLNEISQEAWNGEYKGEINLTRENTTETYELAIHALKSKSGSLKGWLVTLHNTTEQKKILKQLEEMATIDEMTKAINRRHFLELLEREMLRSHRYKLPLSFMLLDIDHFKQINDTYGHPIGDYALIEFSKTCQHITRNVDIFARLGGEEFGLLMPNTTLGQAIETAERLRKGIESMHIEIEGLQFSLTVSIGVASIINPEDQSSSLMQRADQTLYTAKSAGRNRVVAQSFDG